VSLPLSARVRYPDRLAVVTLAVLAVVAWGGALLAADALYWDDWVAQSDAVGLYRDLGLPWMGPIVQALFALGPWSFKVLDVVAVVLVGCAAYVIAGRGLGLDRFERWLVAATLTVLPLNDARISLAVLGTYSLSLVLFMIAWLLVVIRPPSSPGRLRYVVAALLFFVSFTTASLLPFLLVPASHLALLSLRDTGLSWRSVGRLAGRFWYLLAAPIVFWIVRTLFFQPTGLYDDYNSFISFARPLSPIARVTLAGVVLVVAVGVVLLLWGLGRLRRVLRPVAMAGLAATTGLLALASWVSGPPESAGRLVVAVVLALCAALFVVDTVARAIPGLSRIVSTTDPLPRAAVGLLVVFLGALPYLVVGKIPTFFDWETRHQLLLPIGVAVVVLAAWTARPPHALRAPVSRVTWAAGVAVVAIATLATSLTLVGDWRKQTAIIAALAADDEVRGVSTVVFVDNAHSLNFGARPYSTFEYHGWMRTAYGDETHYGVDRAQVGAFLDADPGPLEALGHRYGYSGYRYSSRAILVEIDQVPGTTWIDAVLGKPIVRLTSTSIADLESLR
jgi:hypothetical protein